METGPFGVPTRLTKQVDGNKAIIQNVEQFMIAITQHLSWEDAFVDLIGGMIAAVNHARLPPQTGISMPLSLFYGDPPPAPETRIRGSVGRRHRQPRAPRAGGVKSAEWRAT